MQSTDYLLKLLAHQYGLFYHSQYCHWNVQGQNFSALHNLFESHYTELLKYVDECAELIRMNNTTIKWSFSDVANNSKLPQPPASTDAEEMIKHLVACHTMVIDLLENNPTEDALVDDFVIRSLGFHKKAAWVLNSSL